jgi:hypothetical protein
MKNDMLSSKIDEEELITALFFKNNKTTTLAWIKKSKKYYGSFLDFIIHAKVVLLLFLQKKSS